MLRIRRRTIASITFVDAIFHHAASLGTDPIMGVNALVAVAIDGKTLCGSFGAFYDRMAARVGSAFTIDSRIILGYLLEIIKNVPTAEAKLHYYAHSEILSITT